MVGLSFVVLGLVFCWVEICKCVVLGMGSSVVVHSGFTSFMGFFVARVLVVENTMVFVLFCFVFLVLD